MGGQKVSVAGKPINMHFAEPESYAYLVIDCSVSMTGYKLAQAKKGVIDFAADALKKSYRTGLISFDSSAAHICEPLRDVQQLTPNVNKLKIGGSTNMAEGLKMAHQRLKKLKGARAIVIATDGQPDNARAALKAGQAAKDDGIDIITIGTDDADLEFLEKLATRKELGAKVAPENFASTIAQATNLLPPPSRAAGRKYLR